MDIKITEEYFTYAHNKRKARSAMCKASLLLFAFALFSSVLDVFVRYVSPAFIDGVQSVLVKIISFFGVSGQIAVAAARMFVTSAATGTFMNMITVLFTIVLPAFVFSKMIKKDGPCNIGLIGKTAKGIIPLFCLTQLLCAAVLVFSTGISEFLVPGIEQSGNVAAADSSFNVFGFIMQIICVSFVVPLAEEYAFRGVVFGYLKRYGLSFGIVASAFIFGISHATPSQSVYAFLFGIVAGIVTAVTGNLKTAVVLHMLNNLTIVVQENIKLVLDEKNENLIYCIFMLFVFGFAFYGIYRFVKRGGLQDMYNEIKEQNDKELLYVSGMKDVFVFPVVVYILIYVVSFIAGTVG